MMRTEKHLLVTKMFTNWLNIGRPSQKDSPQSGNTDSLKKFLLQQPVKKIMLTVFWDM